MAKAREFWIRDKQGTSHRIKPIGETIHVIEKSAYDKAVEALQMIAMGYPGDPQLGVAGRDVALGCLKELGEIDD